MITKIKTVIVSLVLVGLVASGLFIFNDYNEIEKPIRENRDVKLLEPMNIIQDKVSLEYELKPKLKYKELING